MGINNPSACMCIWIKNIEQLYIEPLVYKNKRESKDECIFATSSSRPQLTRVALFIQ